MWQAIARTTSSARRCCSPPGLNNNAGPNALAAAPGRRFHPHRGTSDSAEPTLSLLHASEGQRSRLTQLGHLGAAPRE